MAKITIHKVMNKDYLPGFQIMESSKMKQPTNMTYLQYHWNHP